MSGFILLAVLCAAHVAQEEIPGDIAYLLRKADKQAAILLHD